MITSGLYSSENMCWGTPQALFDELDAEFGFTIDVASSDSNAKCLRHYTESDDGLSKSWAGETVWCNPPYGKFIKHWVKKAYEETRRGVDTTVVMLIPARTDTSYFHDYILDGKADEIRFLRGRLKFEDENGVASANSAPFPSAIIVWKSKEVE